MGKYSLIGSSAFEKRVDNDLAKIIKMNASHTTKSIVLVGGFGHGEGTVINDEPFNDYDIVVIGKKRKSSLTELGDFAIELSYKSPQELAHAPCTLFNYEMRYGGHVIYGDTHILDTMPAYQPADLPLFEGTALLLNRGILHLLGYEDKYLIKLFLAMGDSVFLSEHAHELFYQKKIALAPQLFAQAAPPQSEFLVTNYLKACRFKLYGEPFLVSETSWQEALNYFYSFVLWYEGRRLNKHLPSLEAYAAALHEEPFSFRVLVKNFLTFRRFSMPFAEPSAKLLLSLLRFITLPGTKKPYSKDELLSLWRKIA